MWKNYWSFKFNVLKISDNLKNKHIFMNYIQFGRFININYNDEWKLQV